MQKIFIIRQVETIPLHVFVVFVLANKKTPASNEVDED